MCAAAARHRLAHRGASPQGRQFWHAKDLLAHDESGGSARHARKTPDYALHVGRVGALAVSLGVGFAIANSAQPAYADTGTSAESASDSTSDSDAGSGMPSASAEDTEGASESRPTVDRKRGPKTAAAPTEVPGLVAGRKARTHLRLDRPLQVEKVVTAVEQVATAAEVTPTATPETEAVRTEAVQTEAVQIEAPTVSETTPTIPDAKPTVGAVTPKMTAASATLGTRSASAPTPLDLIVNTMMAWVARQISHTFVNRTPVAGPIVYEQNALGQVYIDLNATDPNGDVLKYDIIQPEKGWVYRDLISGKFVYTPWALVTGQPLVDSFKIVVRDDSEHLPGVLGQIQGIVETITRFLGIAQTDNLTVTVPVTVDPVYQAPPLVTPIAGGGFAIGEDPAPIVSAVDIVDGDSGRLSKLTVKIVTLAQNGDALNYVAPSGNPIVGTWDAAERTLTLTGDGTLAQYEEALRAVTFTATQGAALVRGLSISATDEHGVSNVAPGFVAVGVWSPTRYVPLVTPIGGRSYTIGNTPVNPVAAVDIVDADSSHLRQITMTVTTFGKSGDILVFDGLPDNPVTATYDAVTRTLTLSGLATKQQYEEALKAVTFTATQGAWTTRTIAIVATDTDGVQSAAGLLTLSVW